VHSLTMPTERASERERVAVQQREIESERGRERGRDGDREGEREREKESVDGLPAASGLAAAPL